MVKFQIYQRQISQNKSSDICVNKTIIIGLILLFFEAMITSCSFFGKLNNLNYGVGQVTLSDENYQGKVFAKILDQTIEKNQGTARQIAYDTAENSWSKLETNLIARIDIFLDWYFNYFNQKSQDIKMSLSYSDALLKHEFDLKAANQEFNTKLIDNFQELFVERVLQPEQVDIKIREIAVAALTKYLQEIEKSLDKVPQNYNVNQTDWQKYLNQVVVVIKYGKKKQLSFALNSVSSPETHQKLKELIASEKYLVKSEIVSQISQQGARKLLAKTGTNAGALLGVRLIGKKIIALGGVAWELWDYNHAIEVEKPAMRQELIDNLIQVKTDILNNPQSGIMSVIDDLEISFQDNLDLSLSDRLN